MMPSHLPFGVDFFRGTKSEVIRKITSDSQQNYSYIVTPNINHIVRLNKDERLREAYAHASLRLCDSKILYPLLRRLKTPVAEVIPGSTLTSDLMEIANKNSWAVTVIGCEPQEIDKIRKKFPDISIHHYNPPMGFIKDNAAVMDCIKFIKSHASRLIIYSVGCPQQEILAYTLLSHAQGITGVGLCVGASLNFISGKAKRAPIWVQQMGLEWLHRMLTEPRRLFKRYFSDAVSVLPIIISELRRKN